MSEKGAIGKLRRRVLFYCLDQDHESTLSMGIYNYTRMLLRHIAKLDDHGFDLVVLVSDRNSSDLVPHKLPEWFSVMVHGNSFAKGPKRVFADHCLAPILAMFAKSHLIHYPKGWRSAVVYGGIKTVVTMHDIIPDYLHSRYPSETSAIKTAYLWLNGLISAALSTHIITVSHFSRNCLTNRYPFAKDRITTIYEGPGITCTPLPPQEKRNQVLVIGSMQPHKATEETLHLLAGYFSRKQGSTLQVRVAGLDRWPPSWGRQPTLDIAYLGRISDEALSDEMARAMLVLFLSEMEGFGLPFVEAWCSGTPVCFRKKHALSEIGEGFPGAWDGNSYESFERAVDEALGLSALEISVYRNQIESRFNWDNAAQETIRVYQNLLYSS